MKYFIIFTISILGYLLVSLLDNNHLYLTENLGSLWLNIKWFYTLIVGFILGVLYLKFNILSKIFIYFLGVLIVVLLLDSPKVILTHQITLYLFLISLFFQFFLKLKLIK